MILIKDLTKKYKSKNKRVCTALDKVSLTLPDSGMIFIIGKSGSGKSTLLNMIGGLDGFDGGEIIAGGNNLAKFKDRDFYKYRASYVGFIFQDYHLIEELTVSENIRLEAEIANEDNIDLDSALKSVDLEGYGQRYPDELSGGQKQRVAIARALIKSPKVILCDEPTGNLDKNTSTQIMDLLKDISRERLVLIVSHNMPDAEKYADRIIELSDGHIISDLTRREGYTNELTLTDGRLTLPYNRNLSEEEAGRVFEEISSGRATSLHQNDGGYEKTGVLPMDNKKIHLKSSGMKGGSVMRLFSAFSRVGRMRTATTAFISAVMVVLLIIFQSFLMFDGGRAIADSLGEATGGTIVLKKDTYVNKYAEITTSHLYRITEDDLRYIDEISGEQTRKYLLYNYSSTVNLKNIPYMVELEQQFTYAFGKNHIYSPQMAGVLECDDDYLSRKFANGGEIKVLAGDINDSRNSSGIIITDYLADAMMVFNPYNFRSYDDVIGNHDNRASIIAVIDTRYKERYADLISLVSENTDFDTVGFDKVEQSAAASLLDDIKCNLAIGYSLNPDFHTAAVKENTKYYSRTANFEVSCLGETTFLATGDALLDTSGVLKEGEIYISDRILTQMFPDKNPDEIELPFTAEFKRYEFLNCEGELLGDFKFTVVGIANSSGSYFSATDYEKMKEIDIIPYSVYIENYENANELIEGMGSRYFSWNSTEGTAVTLLNKSVNMFFDLFRLIELMILAMTAVFLVSHSIRNVRSNYYQIGVIKAIGGRSWDIAKIFVMQNILLSMAISVLTYVGALVFVDVANDILIESFIRITDVNVGNITIISFDPALVATAIGAAIVIGLGATIAPLILLNSIKPMNIIKAKE